MLAPQLKLIEPPQDSRRPASTYVRTMPPENKLPKGGTAPGLQAERPKTSSSLANFTFLLCKASANFLLFNLASACNTIKKNSPVEVSVHLEGDNEEEWSDLEEDNDDEWSDLEEDNGEGFIASNGAIDQLERTLVELRDRDQASLRNMVEEGVVTRKRKYKTQNKNLVSVTGQKGRWFEVYMNEVPMSIRDFWAALRNGDHDMNDLLRRSILETAGFGKDLYGYDMVLIEFKDFSAFENKSLDNVMEFTVRLQKGGNCRKEEFAKVRANLDSNTVASAYRGANKNIFIVPNQIQSLHGSARRKNFSNLINFVRNAAEDVHINFWKKVAALVPTEFFLKQHLMHDYEEGERIYVYIPESPDEIGWLRVGIVGENSHGTLDVLNEDSYKYSFSRK